MDAESTNPAWPGMALKVGVMGGASGDMTPGHLAAAEALGRAIARSGCVLVTGACPGLPLAAARGAKAAGGTVLGISPGLSLDEHVYKYRSPAEYHDILVFTGSGLMGREVDNIRTSDIVVIVGGRSGTLGELAIAYDEGKLIGVVLGTGGISGMVRDILVACAKETGSRVLYDADPERLLAELLRVYRTEHYRRPSCFEGTWRTGEGAANPAEVLADPVCGMRLPAAAGYAERTHGGRRYVFCCPGCAAAFDADPGKYAAAEEGEVARG
ncbi:MAG: YHS domain-containing protein [Gemmataceae bacterium]|nr:YHS domain-containing protein [Gemmataceae bacterium]